MFGRWEARFLRWRRRFSRSECLARWLGTASDDLTGSEPGLVLVQIDGFSRRDLEQALKRGRMPFLGRLLERERYRLHGFYSGLPATTFAVQSELFYGLKTAVPAVGFRLRSTGEVNMILDPEAAERREAEIAAVNGEPLLAGGSAYGNALHGGAAEPHFCAAALTLRSIAGRIRWRLWPLLLVLYFPTFLRIAWETFLAIFVSAADAWRGIQRGQKAWHEFKFILNRIVVGVVLREWQTYSAQIDVARGLPVIHLNYLSYDEQAHRRGPRTNFAHRALRGVDRSIRKLWTAAARSSRRDYDLWVYADHGQEQVTPYDTKFGRPLHEAVQELMARLLPPSSKEEPTFEMAAIGPVGYIYPRKPLDFRQCAHFAEALVSEAGVPTVLFENEHGRIAFRSITGNAGVLSEGTGAVVGEHHPFLDELNEDLEAMCRHEEAGQIVLLGWAAGADPLSFVPENGAHGGPGFDETHAFALLPGDVPAPAKGYFRPAEFRKAALRRLGRAEIPVATNDLAARSQKAPKVLHKPRRDTLRIVTYNVHSCVGMDGKVSPQRIARVLAQCDPDIVALQELDVGRRRTQSRHQAEEIAHELKMTFHFHPTIRLAGEKYGDAILSRFPMRLVRGELLPGQYLHMLQPRGALWVAVQIGEQEVQVINTHLGLTRPEKMQQVEALLGPDWLGHPEFREPLIVCGDMNFRQRSRAYRKLTEGLRDVPLEAGRRTATFPSRRPIVRIDYVFVRGEFEIVSATTPRTSLTHRASDHLPLVAELRLP